MSEKYRILKAIQQQIKHISIGVCVDLVRVFLSLQLLHAVSAHMENDL